MGFWTSYNPQSGRTGPTETSNNTVSDAAWDVKENAENSAEKTYTAYAAVAIPNSKTKIVAIESAFIGGEKNKDSRGGILNIAEAPQVTSETPNRSDGIFVEDIINQAAEDVKSEITAAEKPVPAHAKRNITTGGHAREYEDAYVRLMSTQGHWRKKSGPQETKEIFTAKRRTDRTKRTVKKRRKKESIKES